MRRARGLVFAASLALCAGGCRVGRGLVVAPEELAAYAPTRTEATLEARMRAAELYLAAYPDGAYASDVRRAYLRADEALWASKRGSTAGLVSYLAALPAGPHAKLARRELDARRRADVDLLGRGAARTEERLAAAEAARVRAREALETWVRRFADPALFGAPIGDAPAEVVVPWSLGLPQPTCARARDGSRQCTKLVTEAFELPRDGERELVLEVVVTETSAGDVCGVGLRGPSLFSRWEEAGSRAAVDLDEPLQLDPTHVVSRREALLSNVSSMVRATHDTRPGAIACSGAAAGHGRDWTFHCGPLRVDVYLAQGAGEDDGVYFSTAYSCSSP